MLVRSTQHHNDLPPSSGALPPRNVQARVDAARALSRAAQVRLQAAMQMANLGRLPFRSNKGASLGIVSLRSGAQLLQLVQHLRAVATADCRPEVAPASGARVAGPPLRAAHEGAAPAAREHDHPVPPARLP